MARLVFLLVLVALIVLTWWSIGKISDASAKRRAAREANIPWQVEESSTNETIVVRAIKPGQQPLVIGMARFADENFNDEIEVLRSQAREKLVALNANQRRLQS